MKEGRDLAVTLITSTILLLGVSYLTQCSTASRRSSPGVAAEAAHDGKAASDADSEREANEGQENEEREKIQRVGRALQTIGANPEMRKTYGFPQ
jgi:hypothetical protein